MAYENASRNLLLGLMGLQNGLINSDDLVTAFARWVRDKRRGLDEFLITAGAIDECTARALWVIVEKLIADQGGAVEKSLAQLSHPDVAASRVALESLGDEELRASCVLLPCLDSLYPTATLPIHGSRLQPRFRVLRPMPGGRGGMGVVQIARDEELGREVALKQIQADKALQPAYRKKFRMEAELTGNLEHPGIIPIYGLGTDWEGNPYYAMRWVQGENFSLAIKRFHRRRSEGVTQFDGIEFRQLVDRLIDAAQAVSYAHSRGVIHRDLKPENVLLGAYGETLVIDWGLAKLNLELAAEQTKENAFHTQPTSDVDPLDQPPWGTAAGTYDGTPLRLPTGHDPELATLHGSFIGTPGYASPEQVRGQVNRVSNRSDVYSLGAMLYHLLTGRPPGDRDGGNMEETLEATVRGTFALPSEVVRHVPHGLAAICMKALATLPEQRYATAREFIDELERWKADEPLQAIPETVMSRTGRWLRRNRNAVTAATLSLVILCLVSWGLTWRAEHHRAEARQAMAQAQLERSRAVKTAMQLAESIQGAYGNILRIEGLQENTARPIRQSLIEELNRWIVQTADQLDRPEDRGNLLFACAGTLIMQANRWTDTISGEESIPILQSAVELAEQAETRAPASLQTRRMGFMTKNNLALRYKDQGHLTEAESILEGNLEAQLQLLERHPASREFLWYDIAMAFHNLGQVAIQQGRWDVAVSRFEHAIRYRQQLLELNSEDEEYRTSLAHTHYELATVLARQQQVDAAEKAFREAGILTNHTGPVWRDCQHARAIMFIEAGQFAEAAKIADEELPYFQRMKQTEPRTIRDLAYWGLVKLDIELGLTHYDDVLQTAKQTTAWLKQMADMNPGYAEPHGLACNVHLGSFRAALQLKKADLAEDFLISFATVSAPWLFSDPYNQMFRRPLATWIAERKTWPVDWQLNAETIASKLNQATFQQVRPNETISAHADDTMVHQAMALAIIGLDDQAEQIVAKMRVEESSPTARRAGFLVAWLATEHLSAPVGPELKKLAAEKRLLAEQRLAGLTDQEQSELMGLLKASEQERPISE